MNHHVKIESIKHVTHDVLQIRVEKPRGYSFTPGQATIKEKVSLLPGEPV
jgi:ferredoxin-NADP reductase